MSIGRKVGKTGSATGFGRFAFGANSVKKKKHATVKKLLQKPGVPSRITSK